MPSTPLPPAVAKASAAAVPRYTSPATGATFLFNSTQADYWSGVDFCAALGAYPAAFSSLLEQYQAESYFTQEVGGGAGADVLRWCGVGAVFGMLVTHLPAQLQGWPCNSSSICLKPLQR